MSWNNVTGVSSATIWTDNPDTTQAYLFANGNHQVKLTVRLVFTVVDANQPGPTQDECKAAVSLVDYQTGFELSFLKAGDKGEYTSVYQENMPTAVKPLPEVDDQTVSVAKSGSYEFDFYVSSDSSINANYASESIALLVTYTDSSGTEKTYDTTPAGKPSYVSVKVYPPKKYGMPNSNITPIIFKTLDDTPKYTTSEGTGVYSVSVKKLTIYSLRIDDSYFRLTSFQAPNTRLSPVQFRQIIESNYSAGNTYGYVLSQGFLLEENNLKGENKSYTASVNVMEEHSGNPNGAVVSFSVDVYQQPYEIIFINFEADVSWEKNADNALFKSSDSAKFTVYDQFGNPANVEVGAGDDPVLELSSVS
ncbi:hypothetical protein [Pseudescherichia sp.]|uniref:hypothetical protein n=1 Tax=Pseudescherichia sp. TaxID=2055881 RepID=UPI0028A00057|nr:hypothetical protein [Pseudescherichia sp.]